MNKEGKFNLYYGNRYDGLQLMKKGVTNDHGWRYMSKWVKKNIPTLGHYYRYYFDDQVKMTVVDFGSHINFFYFEEIIQ